jgi:hypothetical protein
VTCEIQRAELFCGKHDDNLSMSFSEEMVEILFDPLPGRKKAGGGIDN